VVPLKCFRGVIIRHSPIFRIRMRQPNQPIIILLLRSACETVRPILMTYNHLLLSTRILSALINTRPHPQTRSPSQVVNLLLIICKAQTLPASNTIRTLHSPVAKKSMKNLHKNQLSKITSTRLPGHYETEASRRQLQTLSVRFKPLESLRISTNKRIPRSILWPL